MLNFSPMLEAKNISFAYGREAVFAATSFTVRPGETVALVGPNGAGKTTLLRVLAGLLMPTSGHVYANGSDILAYPLRYRRTLGYLPESAPVEPGMTVRGYLRYRASLKGEQSRRLRHRVEEALETCGLSAAADASTDLLSAGQRKRVALADAMVLRPRVLLLDDVLAGLDASAREALTRTLSASISFASVVVSGHELSDLGRFAKRFFVLKGGVLYEAPDVAAARKALA